MIANVHSGLIVGQLLKGEGVRKMSKALIPAVVNGKEVYVPADQIVSAEKVEVVNTETFGQSVKKGAGIAVGVGLVLLAVAALASRD